MPVSRKALTPEVTQNQTRGITDDKIINWFTYHNDPADIPKYQAINEAAINFAKVIAPRGSAGFPSIPLSS